MIGERESQNTSDFPEDFINKNPNYEGGKNNQRQNGNNYKINNFNMPQNFNPNSYYGNQQGMGNYYFNNKNFQNQNQFQNQNLERQGQNENQGNNTNSNMKYQNQPFNNQKFKTFQNFNFKNPMLDMNNRDNDEYNIIQSLKYVSDNYPNLVSLNNNNLGITEKVKAQISPRFYVIKSFTEEDIHKSIKYNCWSSTKEGNKKLNNIYEDCKKNNSDLFLFFSMNGSGRFVGVAKMTGKVDESAIFEYWAMDEVWRGLMPVEWVIIKDIPNRFLKEIKLSNNQLKPVTNSRDTQEIPREEGEQMLSIFEDFMYQTSLLQHFQYYDERQDQFEKARKVQQHQHQQKKY